MTARTLECLGGSANVTQLEACSTRLRLQVANPALVDVRALHALGAYGVVISGHVVQVVAGAQASAWAEEAQLALKASSESARPAVEPPATSARPLAQASPV